MVDFIGRSVGKLGPAFLKNYSTDWISRSDWTNVHVGSGTTKDADSNVTHNLGRTIDKLGIKLFISATGADSDAIEIPLSSAGTLGVTAYYIDKNNIKLQTGSTGLQYLGDTGAQVTVAAQDWYYKVKVFNLANT